MDTDRVSLSRRFIVVALVGVCILSAGVGSGITLLAKTGPTGPAGPVGPEGPPGNSAEDARWEAEEAVSKAEDLDSRVSDLEWEQPVGQPASQSEVSSLESEIWDLESSTSAICRALGIVC